MDCIFILNNSKLHANHLLISDELYIVSQCIKIPCLNFTTHDHQRFSSVVVITFASHAKGPRFDPGLNQMYIVLNEILRIAEISWYNYHVWSMTSHKKLNSGPAEIWTRITGFRVLSANHYTTGPLFQLNWDDNYL